MKKEKILESLGLRIKNIRNQMGISQETLAYRSELDRTYISGLERGLRNPSLSCVFRLAQGLEISASELIKELEIEN